MTVVSAIPLLPVQSPERRILLRLRCTLCLRPVLARGYVPAQHTSPRVLLTSAPPWFAVLASETRVLTRNDLVNDSETLWTACGFAGQDLYTGSKRI